MRRKASTLLDESLSGADMAGDASAESLDSKAASLKPGGVVAESWGILPLPTRQVRELLAEEDGLFDS